MYFSTKSYLKSTRNHTAKHAFNQIGTNFCYHFRNAIAEPFYFYFFTRLLSIHFKSEQQTQIPSNQIQLTLSRLYPTEPVKFFLREI